MTFWQPHPRLWSCLLSAPVWGWKPVPTNWRSEVSWGALLSSVVLSGLSSGQARLPGRLHHQRGGPGVRVRGAGVLWGGVPGDQDGVHQSAVARLLCRHYLHAGRLASLRLSQSRIFYISGGTCPPKTTEPGYYILLKWMIQSFKLIFFTENKHLLWKKHFSSNYVDSYLWHKSVHIHCTLSCFLSRSNVITM